MRRVLLVILILFFNILPGVSYQEDVLQNIFITDIPDPPQTPECEEDTSAIKGYAEYLEGADAVYLTDDEGQFVLNLREPQKIESKRLIEKKVVQAPQVNPQAYTKFSSDEYRISDFGKQSKESIGNFTFGTVYNSSVSTAQLERETGLFTRYEIKNFALNTSYKKTLGTTGGVYYDKIYFAPEYKLNNIFTVKDVFSVDPVRNRKKNEVVLSVNPFGNSDKDRMNFEMSAGQTYDVENYIIRSQIEFNTRFKL